jgi:hypothetical protein
MPMAVDQVGTRTNRKVRSQSAQQTLAIPLPRRLLGLRCRDLAKLETD